MHCYPNVMVASFDCLSALCFLIGNELPQFVQVMAVATAVILASKMFRS